MADTKNNKLKSTDKEVVGTEQVVKNDNVKKTKELLCEVVSQRGTRCIVNLNGTMISVNSSDRTPRAAAIVEYTGEIGMPNFTVVKIK